MRLFCAQPQNTTGAPLECRAAHGYRERPPQMSRRKDSCRLKICRVVVDGGQTGDARGGLGGCL